MKKIESDFLLVIEMKFSAVDYRFLCSYQAFLNCALNHKHVTFHLISLISKHYMGQNKKIYVSAPSYKFVDAMNVCVRRFFIFDF